MGGIVVEIYDSMAFGFVDMDMDERGGIFDG